MLCWIALMLAKKRRTFRARWFANAIPLVTVATWIAMSGGKSHAFDDRDDPQRLVDPATDIADTYAFMRPEPNDAGGYEPSSHLVLIATFDPGAAQGSPFPAVTYQFQIRHLPSASDLSFNGLASAPNFKVVCSFADGTPQKVTCAANGTFATANIEDADGGAPTNDVRVFAGVRADPAFADQDAFIGTVQAGQLQFKPGSGKNSFAGRTVRALVVEFNVNRVGLAQDASPTAPATAGIWAVSVESIR